jgi:hypothetical protein
MSTIQLSRCSAAPNRSTCVYLLDYTLRRAGSEKAIIAREMTHQPFDVGLRPRHTALGSFRRWA